MKMNNYFYVYMWRTYVGFPQASVLLKFFAIGKFLVMENKKTNSNFNMEIEKLPYGQSIAVHCCCAPCTSVVLLTLAKQFKLYLYFYNPNLDSFEEYNKRLSDLQEFVVKVNKKLTEIENAFFVEVIDGGYNSLDFYNAIKGNEDCPEGGQRCEICYALRLKKTIEWAKQNDIKYIVTSLTLSPQKNAEKINEIGNNFSDNKTIYLASNFKKKNGYLNSIRFSKLYNLYRQNYCGCVFSIKREKNNNLK